ncbi:MAG: molybdenum cofactor guanylyltransferase [Candidatus Omnitrophota bacterium]|nr:molybdenum cofactor guanylyltransferase [Candidatus Omnitrophota bacterium]
MNAIILAGGKSRRMGFDKAFIKIEGMPIIKRELSLLKKIFKEVIIVTNGLDKYRGFKKVSIIKDVIPERGPLGGIYSGLISSNSLYNFVVACDMPFINEALIKYMIKNKESYDIILPKINGRYHPLFGIYNKRCLPIIKHMLEQNRLKISDIFLKLKCYFISRKKIEEFDQGLLSLVNINTKDDLLW